MVVVVKDGRNGERCTASAPYIVAGGEGSMVVPSDGEHGPECLPAKFGTIVCPSTNSPVS